MCENQEILNLLHPPHPPLIPFCGLHMYIYALSFPSQTGHLQYQATAKTWRNP